MTDRAVAGADGNTPWIWLHLFVPLLALIPLFFVDWRRLVTFDETDPTAVLTGQLAVLVSPAYLATIAASLVAYGISVAFAALDHRTLVGRQVARPFPWAFAFLGNWVYLIGRTVVVVRRTGRGYAPLWAALVIFGLTIAGSVWFTAWLMLLVLEQIPSPTG